MKLIDAFRAGATGQPVPGEADRLDGGAIAQTAAATAAATAAMFLTLWGLGFAASLLKGGE